MGIYNIAFEVVNISEIKDKKKEQLRVLFTVHSHAGLLSKLVKQIANA